MNILTQEPSAELMRARRPGIGLFGKSKHARDPMPSPSDDPGQRPLPERLTNPPRVGEHARMTAIRKGEAPGPLGGSMRAPFDYDAARKALVGDQKKISPWAWGLAALGDALTSYGGSEPWAVQNLSQMQSAQTERMRQASATLAGWQRDDYEASRDADLKAANPFTIGRNRLQFDPTTGEVATLYDGAEDAEIYADALGLERGSQEWTQAYEDFVLRGSGPSAHLRDMELDDHRTGNDRSLEGYRQGNRISLENLRQRNRSSMEGQRQSNRMTLRQTPPAPRISSARQGGGVVEVKTPAEARKLPKGTRFRTPDGKVMVR